MKNYLIGILILFAATAGVLWKTSVGTLQLGDAAYDTVDQGVTNTSVTVNTTSTQVLASITKWAVISNDTANKLSCFLDNLGTTAASSSVAAGVGLVVGSSTVRTVQFGECTGTAEVCVPFKGTVNCLANAQSVISVIKK